MVSLFLFIFLHFIKYNNCKSNVLLKKKRQYSTFIQRKFFLKYRIVTIVIFVRCEGTKILHVLLTSSKNLSMLKIH